tara:strand:- start:26 stop:1174 length:1149 start_codon:yes stop_codon:yes gene_type:complete
MQIDYKKLIKKYETNLVDKLRGFGEEDFLNFWVPASDDLTSIINLIDALYESKFYKIQIINLDLSDSDIKELKKFTNIAIKTITKDSIDINIIPKKYVEFKEKNRKISNSLHNKKFFEEIDTLEDLDINENIDEFYLNASSGIKIKNKILEYPSIKNSKYNYFEINFSNNQKLVYAIDIATQKIKFANHISLENTRITKILDLFCDLILEKDFQEMSEHSCIYLEHELRLLSKEKRSLKGIYLPTNSGGLFNYINKNIRENFKIFTEKNNINLKINKEYYSGEKEWNEKSEDQKKIVVKEVLEKHIFRQFNINDEDIKLNRIIQNNRLEFILSSNLKKDYQDNKLFKIEEILKNKIDKSIELFSMEEIDSNKLRLSNAPKSI